MQFLKTLGRGPATLSIMAVLLVVFIAQLVDSRLGGRLSLPSDPASVGGRPWSPLTVLFLHEHIGHLAVMVLVLAAFGALLERSARGFDVVAVYLLAGLAGSLAALAVGAGFRVLQADGSLVGASAAVLGVAAAALAMPPSSRVFGGTATQWLAVLIAVNIVFLFSQPLSSVAHLGGIAVGWAYGQWLRTRAPLSAGQTT